MSDITRNSGQARSDFPSTMRAARLHGPRDLRVEEIPLPGPPREGEVVLRILCTGICGSDLHFYQAARIGDIVVESPIIPGHEFAGVVEAVGEGAVDGYFKPVVPGALVAVDPAQPCGQCEMCEQGNPNLCHRLGFCSNYPLDGSLCEWMRVPARTCFPVPEVIDPTTAALLEPLGVAIHSVDLARINVGNSVAIVGAGPIGLSILQVARLAGADPIFVCDRFPWRLKLAERFGGIPIHSEAEKAEERIAKETAHRGVDVAIEAAWCDGSVNEAAEMARLGGRLVVVGIPADDRLQLKHGVARRKGLTIRMCRRMKHVYPRAIRLAAQGKVDLSSLVSHRFPLDRTAEAFALNEAYRDDVVKVVVENDA